MKTKMLALGLVLALSLQAMPMSADSGHCFSLNRLRAGARNTKSWIKENPKRTIGIAAAVATTVVVAYLCKGQIKTGSQSLFSLLPSLNLSNPDNLSNEFDPTNGTSVPAETDKTGLPEAQTAANASSATPAVEAVPSVTQDDSSVQNK